MMRPTRVCLVSTGQPSSNPRLVKEADALTDAGYDVRAVGVHWAPWADRTDERLLATRRWSCQLVDARRTTAGWTFWRSRIRHRLAREAASGNAPAWLLDRAVSPLTPELIDAASSARADLFIAHNLGALPAAVHAARRWGAVAGFDAEDWHSGELSEMANDRVRVVVRATEERYVPQAAYLTAASPGIAAAYASLTSHAAPTVILNVFPLRDRPASLRPLSTTGPVRAYWFSQTVGPHRGLETAVRALGAFRDGELELHLRGVWAPGYREALGRVMADCGVDRDRVVHHEPGDPDEMIRLASDFDIGLAVEPGTTANNRILLSNKIFTYLLAGLAVVATQTPGQAPLIEELGVAARGAAPGDSDSLVAALKPWVENRGQLIAARDAAWQAGGARYNWDRERYAFLALLEKQGLGPARA